MKENNISVNVEIYNCQHDPSMFCAFLEFKGGDNIVILVYLPKRLGWSKRITLMRAKEIVLRNLEYIISHPHSYYSVNGSYQNPVPDRIIWSGNLVLGAEIFSQIDSKKIEALGYLNYNIRYE